MANKFRADSLTKKMVIRLLRGLSAGLFLFVVFYFGSVNLLRQYLFSSGFFYNIAIDRIEEFQQHVFRDKLAATDTAELRRWAEDRNIDEFTVSRGEQLLFDVEYKGEIVPGSKEMSVHNWRDYFTVDFADGIANVYIYEGAAEKYFHLLLGVSTGLGFAACLAIFIQGMKDDVVYIGRLKDEVEVISHGNLQERVTVQGEDELAQLALGLDRMREKLKEREQTERELRAAQEKLVMGMSHDLRTPLTGLLTYMEILKKQEREGKVTGEYIDKAYNKILLIKLLSEQMFEYFFIDSQKETALEPPEDICSVLGDYLSEMCALLIDDGFSVNADGIEWQPVFVRMNTDYIGRIMNNIISNIEKYGDRGREVKIELFYRQNKVEISIINAIAAQDKSVEGTKIGVKNISLMMEKMGGTAETGVVGETYRIKLYFPIFA